jgi:hypothetical protein
MALSLASWASQPSPFDGAWRRRLALKAAAASARIARRGEDEATLRDGVRFKVMRLCCRFENRGRLGIWRRRN